jgi:hypothetical protein
MGPNLDNQELNFERFTLMRPFPRELIEDIFKFYKRFDDDCWIFPPEMIALKTFKLVKSNIAKDYFIMKGIISNSKIVMEHQVKMEENNNARLIPPEDNFNIVPDTVKKCVSCLYPSSSHMLSDCKKLRLEEEKEFQFKCPFLVTLGKINELNDKLGVSNKEMAIDQELELEKEKKRALNTKKAFFNQTKGESLDFLDFVDNNFRGKMKNIIPKKELIRNQDLDLDLPVLREVSNNNNNNNYFNQGFISKFSEDNKRNFNSVPVSQNFPSFTSPFQSPQGSIGMNPFQSSQISMIKKETPKIVLSDEQEAEIFLGKLNGRILGDKNGRPLKELVEDLQISFEVEDFIKMKNLKMGFEDYCIMKGVSSRFKKKREVEHSLIPGRMDHKGNIIEEDEE